MDRPFHEMNICFFLLTESFANLVQPFVNFCVICESGKRGPVRALSTEFRAETWGVHPRPQYAHIRQLESSKEVQSSHVPHQSKRFWIRQLGGASPHGFLWFDWRAVDMGRGMVRRHRWHAFHECLATTTLPTPLVNELLT